MYRFAPIFAALLTAGIFTSLAARADHDRFSLRLGAIQVEGNAHVDAIENFSGNAYSYSSGQLDFGAQTVPRVDGTFRFSQRNRLLFNYFSYKNDNRYILDDDLSLDEGFLPAGTVARTEAAFDLGSLIYDYAFFQTRTMSVGGQIGAAWARLRGRVSADNELLRLRIRDDIKGAAPVAGLRVSAMTADHTWGFTGQAQYLDARWGNFDTYAGNISRANALIEYRFTENFGVYGGYDWFRLNARRSQDNDNVGIDLRFMGPTAGMSFAF